MTCLISGETVTVRNAAHSLDELGDPNGVTVAFTLCFPKGADVSLKDATVTVRGTDYKVVGDPKRYTAANTPGPWDLTCEVTRTDG